MKKATLIFCLTLIGLYGILGCFVSKKDPYLAEKRFWKAGALAQRIVANPETTPPLLFRKARQNFQELIKDYAHNTVLVQESLLSTGGLFIHEKKFQEARDLLAQAKLDHPNKHFHVRAQFLIGFSYEKEGDWETAVEEYHALMEKYPEHQLALQTPLYIARHDLRQDTTKGLESYREAAHFYRRVITKYPKGSPIGYLALSYMLTGYHEQKDWGRSFEVVREIVINYPRVLKDYVPMIEGLSHRLKDSERAIALFQGFIEAYPDHQDVTLLKKRIERLERSRKNVS